jgi:hypothetical protein
MTRSLARHLGLHLLALVMSGVFLAPKVIHAYNIKGNNNVRPFYHKAPRIAETNALIPFFVRSVCQLAVYVFGVSSRRISRPC